MKMKKFVKALCLALVVFSGVMMFGGCFNGTSLENIDLSEPLKTDYKLNEALDLGTSKLVLTYSDDSQRTISITTSMISGFDSSTCGRKTMTITYKDKSKKVDYVVYTTDAATVKSAIRTKLVDTDKILLQATKTMEKASSTFTCIRNSNIYKVVGINDADEQYYDTKSHKEYKIYEDPKRGETGLVDFNGNDEQMIDTFFLLNGYSMGCTISNQKVKIANGEYVLTYNYTTSTGTTHNVTINASMDCSIRAMNIVETLTADADYKCIYALGFTYGDSVPAITFPSI